MNSLSVNERSHWANQFIGLALSSIRYLISVIVFLGGASITGCGKDNPSFSVLPSSKSFKQGSSTVNNKLDILWVVDNSGSMNPIQNTLTTAFQSFIQGFQQKNYNFHMSVTSSEAYLAGASYTGNSSYARFKDGVSSHTGVFVATNSTPNLNNVFVTNASLGSNGNGDERVFQSFMETLSNPVNNQYSFRRADAFLAVIIVSDEDDFSTDGSGSLNRNYNSPLLHSVTSYVNYLDQKTQSTAALRRYSVSAITIKDSACASAQAATGGIMGQRYMALATVTNGVVGDLCASSYASTLNEIQNKIAELSTQFYLSRVPVESTIVVYVNNVFVPNSTTNGWTFNPASNSIVFHGSSIPAQGAAISVDYDPTTIM
jgi:hypothetical protein